jgi:heme O synthase-like polyprenyltransferase
MAVNRLDRRPRRRLTDRVHPIFGALALIAGLTLLWLVVGFFWAFLAFYGIFVAALVLLTI